MVLKTFLVIGLGVAAGLLGVIINMSLAPDPSLVIGQSNLAMTELADAIDLSDVSEIKTRYLLFRNLQDDSNIFVDCTSSSLDPRYIQSMELLGYELVANGC